MPGSAQITKVIDGFHGAECYREDQAQRDRGKSGHTISISGRLVLGGENLYLLLVQGSEMQWHKNALKNLSISIDGRA